MIDDPLKPVVGADGVMTTAVPNTPPKPAATPAPKGNYIKDQAGNVVTQADVQKPMVAQPAPVQHPSDQSAIPPPGFTLDASQGVSGAVPPPPPGFTLDQQPSTPPPPVGFTLDQPAPKPRPDYSQMTPLETNALKFWPSEMAGKEDLNDVINYGKGIVAGAVPFGLGEKLVGKPEGLAGQIGAGVGNLASFIVPGAAGTLVTKIPKIASALSKIATMSKYGKYMAAGAEQLISTGTTFGLQSQIQAPLTTSLKDRIKILGDSELQATLFAGAGLLGAVAGKVGKALTYPAMFMIGYNTSGKDASPAEKVINGFVLTGLHAMSSGVSKEEAAKIAGVTLRERTGMSDAKIQDIEAELLKSPEYQAIMEKAEQKISLPTITAEEAAQKPPDTGFPPLQQIGTVGEAQVQGQPPIESGTPVKPSVDAAKPPLDVPPLTPTPEKAAIAAGLRTTAQPEVERGPISEAKAGTLPSETTSDPESEVKLKPEHEDPLIEAEKRKANGASQEEVNRVALNATDGYRETDVDAMMRKQEELGRPISKEEAEVFAKRNKAYNKLIEDRLVKLGVIKKTAPPSGAETKEGAKVELTPHETPETELRHGDQVHTADGAIGTVIGKSPEGNALILVHDTNEIVDSGEPFVGEVPAGLEGDIKEVQDAIRKSSAEGMDVRELPGDGGAVGETHPEGQVSAQTGKTKKPQKVKAETRQERLDRLRGTTLTLDDFLQESGGLKPYSDGHLTEEIYGQKGRGGIEVRQRAKKGKGLFADEAADEAISMGLLPPGSTDMDLLRALKERKTIKQLDQEDKLRQQYEDDIQKQGEAASAQQRERNPVAESKGELALGKQDLSLAGETVQDTERIQKNKDAAVAKQAELERRAQELPGVSSLGAAASVPSPEGAPDFFGGLTGTKNEYTKEMQKRLGWTTTEQPSKSDADALDEAFKVLANNKSAGSELVQSLIDHPRPPSATERMVLLHETTVAEKTLNKAVSEGHALEAVGDENAIDQNRALVVGASEKLQKLFDIAQSGSAEWGRAGSAMQRMMDENYSLSRIVVRRQAATGKTLTPEQMNEAKTLSDKYEKIIADMKVRQAQTEKETTARVEQESKDRAAKEFQNYIRETIVRGQEKSARPFSEKALKFIDDQADAAMARISERKRQGRMYAVGIDPEALADYTIIGSKYLAHGIKDFAVWSNRMIKDFGETIKPYLKQIWAGARRQMGEARVKEEETKTGEEPEEGKPTDLGKLVKQLMRGEVEQGVRKLEDAVKNVHEILTDTHLGLTLRQVRDAFSDYGKVRQPSKDEISRTLQDLRSQSQKVSQLEDVLRGEPPKKTGQQRAEPSQRVRELTKQVNEAMKKMGIEARDPAKQLKSSLDAIKTRLGNQIEDLSKAIDSRERMVTNKNAVPYDTEANALKAKRDALRSQYDDIFAKPEMTDEQRLNVAMKSAERSADEWDNHVKEAQRGNFEKAKKGEKLSLPESKELDALKAKRDASKAEFDRLKEIAFPKRTPEEVARASYKTRVANEIKKNQSKLDRGDFSKTPKPEPRKLDPEELHLKSELAKIKRQVDVLVLKDTLANRSGWQKMFEQIAGVARASALSGYHTLAKLASYSGAKLLETPLTEATGKALDVVPLFKQIGERGQFEGGESTKAIAKFYTEFATTGMKNAWKQLRTGSFETKSAFGDQKVHTAPHWYDFFGNLHMSEKAPLLTAQDAMLFEKYQARALAAGHDITDEMVQGAIRMQVFSYAQSSILQERNAFADIVHNAESKMEKPDPVTGKASVTQNMISMLLKTFITKGIVRTPSNYIAQTLARTPFGLIRGLIKAVNAGRTGVAELHPKEADAIRRLLKVGTVGSAMFVWGMLDALRDEKDRVFGGYYQPGQKRADQDAKWATIRIGGVQLSHFLTHNPMTESAQMGNTIMRVAMTKLSKKDANNQGLLKGTVAALLGLAEQAPIASTGMRIAESRTLDTNRMMGELLRGLIPQFVENIAADLDKEKGEPIRRDPKTMLEHVEMGVPGLRQNVPRKRFSIRKGAF